MRSYGSSSTKWRRFKFTKCCIWGAQAISATWQESTPTFIQPHEARRRPLLLKGKQLFPKLRNFTEDRINREPQRIRTASTPGSFNRGTSASCDRLVAAFQLIIAIDAGRHLGEGARIDVRPPPGGGRSTRHTGDDRAFSVELFQRE